jgi:hypothetical protein
MSSKVDGGYPIELDLWHHPKTPVERPPLTGLTILPSNFWGIPALIEVVHIIDQYHHIIDQYPVDNIGHP